MTKEWHQNPQSSFQSWINACFSTDKEIAEKMPKGEQQVRAGFISGSEKHLFGF